MPGADFLRLSGGKACSSAAAVMLASLAGTGGVVAQSVSLGFPPIDLTTGPFEFETAEQEGIRVELVAQGFARPFSVALLPNGDALISERGGAVRLIRNATGEGGEPELLADPVAGSPTTESGRGRGLHEVVVHPDFASNSYVYLSWNEAATEPVDGQPASVLMVGRAQYDDGTLTDLETLFSSESLAGGSGSRIAFHDGYMYVTTGAPFGDDAQSTGNAYGKVLRLHEDGSIPDDNPFIDVEGARPEIYSLGHRDQLGLTVHPESGTVLAVEHGPNGGDEVNLILPGKNYGWPDYSYGRTYDGPRHSAQPLGPDTEQPLVLWVPSIGPSGITFYAGDAFPEWQGNLFVGSARRGQIPGTGGLERVVLNENLEEIRRESLLGGLRARIRDVRQGPDGMLYVLTDDQSPAVLRISPR